MRVAVGGIMHESNTFVDTPTGLDAFALRCRGREIAVRWGETHHEMAGFLQSADELGFELVPTLMASATPGGPVTAEAFETLTGELLAALAAGPKPDGMLLACHGALVSEAYPDGDGEIIRRVRGALGAETPLVVTLDFHANISPAMVEGCDALIVYKTNPHVDQRQRGVQAAHLLRRILAGEVRPVQALARPAMVWNILHQNTSKEPLRSIMADGAALEDDPRFLAVSVAAGYPYADVEEMGPSVVVVADGDPEAAHREAERLSGRLWDARDNLEIRLPDAAEAVSRAMQSERTPVVLVEMGDNIGGGSPGDGTAILGELVRQGGRDAVTVLYDPEAVRLAREAGVGAAVSLEVGGKTDGQHGAPVRIEGQVRSLHDGLFHEPEPRHGGATDWDQGPTAVIELSNGSLVVLNSARTAPMSLHQLISLDIAPETMKILVVKAAIAYRAAYEPVAGEILEVDTPGVTAVDPLRFEYRHVRRPLWPLP